MIKIATVIALTAIVSGCGTSGGNESIRKESQQSISTKITVGKSTKTDVRRTFGDPQTVSFTDQAREIWHYEFNENDPKFVSYIPYVNIACNGSTSNKKTLAILFNNQGVVWNSTFLDSKSENWNGVCK